PSAEFVPTGPSGRGAPVSELSGDGGGLLRADQGLAHHAHHRDPEAGARRASPGRAPPLQHLPRIETPPPPASTRSPGRPPSTPPAARPFAPTVGPLCPPPLSPL